MAEKSLTKLKREADLDRWFLVQCLARNKDYCDLYDDYARRLKRRREVTGRPWELNTNQISYVEFLLDKRMMSQEGQRDLESRIQRGKLTELELSVIAQKEKSPTLRNYFLVSLSGKFPARKVASREKQKLDARLKEIETDVTHRFGIPYLVDARPHMNEDPSHPSWIADTFAGSIHLVQFLEPPKYITEGIDPGEWRGAVGADNPSPDEWVLSKIDDGLLPIFIDVRNPPGQILYELHQVVRVLRALQEKTLVQVSPRQRPHRDVKFLQEHFRVWDRYQENARPDDIAREVFAHKYDNEDPGNARSLTSQYRARADDWISLRWNILGAAPPKG